MVKVDFHNPHNFKFDEEKVVSDMEEILKENDADSASVSVAIVNQREMTNYAMEYMKESEEEAKEHPVLSFPTAEIEMDFKLHKEEQNYLGEIIVSYEMGKDTKGISDLACHGLLHLIGIHHD